MTLNPDVVRSRCGDTEDACARLARYAGMPADAFVADRDAVDAAVYRLLVAMEAVRLHAILRDHIADLRLFAGAVARLLQASGRQWRGARTVQSGIDLRASRPQRLERHQPQPVAKRHHVLAKVQHHPARKRSAEPIAQRLQCGNVEGRGRRGGPYLYGG